MADRDTIARVRCGSCDWNPPEFKQRTFTLEADETFPLAVELLEAFSQHCAASHQRVSQLLVLEMVDGEEIRLRPKGNTGADT